MFKKTALILIALATPVLAVKTSYWHHKSQEDFKAGTLHSLVVSNHGEIRLSRDVKQLLDEDRQITSVDAIVEGNDGSIYFGTGPEAEVFRYKEGKIESVAKFEAESMITSLAVDKHGHVLVGVSGTAGEIYRVDKPGAEPKKIFTDENTQYIWALVLKEDDTLFAATGPNGQIFKTDINGKNAKEFAKVTETNVLSMIAGDKVLYAGTDTDGIIYRINDQSGEQFVLYDSAETDVTSLKLDDKGNLFAATGDINPEEAENGHLPGEEKGQPEKPGVGEGLDSGKPAVPPVAPQPVPAPGDPAPIPPAKPDAVVPAAGDKEKTIPAPTGTDANAGPVEPKAGTDETGAKKPEGNAIYRIDAGGFVTEVFRGPVVIYGLAIQDQSLLVATGDEGEVYEIDPGNEEAIVLAHTDSQQVSCIYKSKGGQIFLGLSNAGQLAVMSAGPAKSGTYDSAVLDATQTSLFGMMRLRGQLPTGTKLTVCTRSGNVEDAEHEGWSEWSEAKPATEFVKISSPAARYIQYKLELTTEDGKQSPAVDEVSVAYQKPNVAPHIASITTTADPAALGKVKIAWEATDANEDALKYDLFIRTAGHGAWIKLAEHLTTAEHDWDTTTIADGRYEVRVVASDAEENEPGEGKTVSRVSDIVEVDNTPPVIGDIKIDVKAGTATVSLRVVDRSNPINTVDFSVNSTDHWQRSLPDDKIADSPEERYTLKLSDLPKGASTVTIRATDEMGNTSYETVTVNAPDGK